MAKVFHIICCDYKQNMASRKETELVKHKACWGTLKIFCVNYRAR